MEDLELSLQRKQMLQHREIAGGSLLLVLLKP
jgi:hypothetical protein